MKLNCFFFLMIKKKKMQRTKKEILKKLENHPSFEFLKKKNKKELTKIVDQIFASNKIVELQKDSNCTEEKLFTYLLSSNLE